MERSQAHSQDARLNERPSSAGFPTPPSSDSSGAGLQTPPVPGPLFGAGLPTPPVPGPKVSPGPGAPPVVSIVIPTYNGRGLLERCLASIFEHLPPDPAITLEVLVSDDASTDGTPDWLASAYPDVRVIRAERNGGFCTAANAGIAAARGRFIQLLNNDTEVSAGWIESAISLFADPSVGSVAPLVRIRSQPARVDSAGDSYNLFGRPAKRGHGQPARLFAGRAVEEVFGASGSSAFYRADVLKRLGGYDSLYGSYYEDVDLAFRLRWAGSPLLVCPGLRDLPRRLRDIRSPQPDPSAPDVPQRRAPLLDQHARPKTGDRPRAASLLPDRADALATRQKEASAIPAGQARRRLRLARNPRSSTGARNTRAKPSSDLISLWAPGYSPGETPTLLTRVRHRDTLRRIGCLHF